MGYRSLAANTKFSIVHACAFYVYLHAYALCCSAATLVKLTMQGQCACFSTKKVKVGEVMFYSPSFTIFENECESTGLFNQHTGTTRFLIQRFKSGVSGC